MNKKKTSIILKICVITLLIILSTMGVVRAEEYWAPDRSYPGSSVVDDPNSIGFDTLESNEGVLCDQHGKELQNRKKLSDTIDGSYPEDVVSGYYYETTETLYPTAEEAYILANITGGGHLSRPSQWAWWAHGRAMGSATGRGLGAIDFSITPFSTYSVGSIAFGLSEPSTPLDDIKDSIEIVGKEFGENVQKKINSYIEECQKENKTAMDLCNTVCNDPEIEEKDKKKIVSEITNNLYGVSLSDTFSSDDISAGGKLSTEARYFQEYVDTYLEGNSTLKEDYRAKIDSDDLSVLFDESYQSWLIGPLKIHYPDAVYGDVRFAGISSMNLRALDNGNEVALEYASNTNVTDLSSGQYIFLKDVMGNKFDDSYNNYPDNDTEFYIAVKYSEGITQLTNFNYDINYLTYDANAYTVFRSGDVDKYTWKTTNISTWDKYKYNKEKDKYEIVQWGFSKEETYDGYNVKDFPPAPNDGYYYWNHRTSTSKVEGTAYRVFDVAQDLVESGMAKLEYKTDTASVEIPFSRNIQITKSVKDNSENDINTKEDFHYMIIMDTNVNVSGDKVQFEGKEYKIVDQGSIYAGNPKIVTLPPIYLEDVNGKYPETYVIEVDGKGTPYYEWENNKYDDSLWSIYTPVDNGVVKLDDKLELALVHLTNIRKTEHSHLTIDKKIKNADGTPVWFNIQLTDYSKNINGDRTTYTIEVTPKGGERVTSDFRDSNGNVIGTITTGTWDGYDHALVTSNAIEWTGKQPTRYDIHEVDQFGDTYLQYIEYGPNRNEESIWNKYECPKDYNSSGSFHNHECDCDGSSAITGSVNSTIATFTNIKSPKEVELELYKINPNSSKDETVLFDVQLEGYYNGSDETTSSASIERIGTLEIKTNSNEPAKIKHKINNPISEYNYFISLKENKNQDNWTDFEVDNSIVIDSKTDIIETAEANKDSWIIKKDETGVIIQATKMLSEQENKLTATAVNTGGKTYYTGLRLQKTIIDNYEDRVQDPKYPDAFFFKVKLSNHGNLTQLTDWTSELFNEEDLIETDNNGIIVRVDRNSNNEYILNSNIVEWDFSNNPKWITPVVKVIEVDQYGEEYSENPSHEDSLWNDFKQVGSAVAGLNVYTDKNTAEDAFNSNKITVVEAKNSRIYNGNIEIEKTLIGKDWDEKDKFYFTIDVLNNSMDCESIIETYFDQKYTTAKDQDYKGSKPAIVITKDQNPVISKDIEWYSNESNPQFVIREVDQYGCSWHGSVDNIEHEDSTWYQYQPSKENPYNSVTAQILPGKDIKYSISFENTAQVGTIVLDKVIDNSEFLDHEKFYFKVEENGKDVTKDLFDKQYIENGYVVVDKKAHDAGGIVSTEQTGKHKYVITEYDENGVTYDAWKKGSNSDFWGVEFIPANNGVWNVELNTSDGPSFIKAKNYRVVNNLEVIKEISGNISEEDYDKEFTAELFIIPNKYTGKIWVKEKESNNFKEYDSYSEPIKVTANKSYTLEGIAWEGEAPIWGIAEYNLPEGWIFKGYEIDGVLSKDMNATYLKDLNENKIVIQNEKPEDVTVQITKNIVDLQGRLITLKQDSPEFHFDVLAKNVVGNTILVDGKEVSIDGTDVDGYTKLTTIDIIVPAGQTSKTIDITGIGLESGTKIEYKVIEVDQYGEPYSEKPSNSDSIWNKTKPTMFSNGKWGSNDGIWNGFLSNDNPTSCVAKIDAYNTIRKVDINLVKHVIKDGVEVPIAKGEVFKFVGEFNDEKIDIEITYEDQTWSQEFILDLDEELKYTITEVDEKGNSYEKRTEDSIFWKEFKPSDGKGIIEGIVKENTDGSIYLNGSNTKIEEKSKHGELVLTKTVQDSEGTIDKQDQQPFYFIVEQNGKGNVVDSLFEESVITKIGENKDISAIELYAGDEIHSKPQTWKENENAPTFTVREVDQYGEKYSKNPSHEDSLWNKYEPKHGNGVDVTLNSAYSDEEVKETLVTTHHETNTKIDKQPFTITKKVDGKPIAEGENFYFRITNNGEQLNKDQLLELFPDLKDEDIHDNLIHFYKTADKTLDTVTSKDVDLINNKYVVTEVDQYNATQSDKHENDSIWNEYSVDCEGSFEVTKEQPTIIIENEGIKPNEATVLITKQLSEGQEWTDEVFKFQLYKNGEKYGEEFELTSKHTSESFDFKWKKDEKAPKIAVIETNGEPVTIKVDEDEYNPTIDENGIPTSSLSLSADHKFTFKFENDVMTSGKLKVTKKLENADNSSNQEFNFEYHYKLPGENDWGNTYSLTLKPGETKETKEIQWNKKDTAPEFEIWEVNNKPKSIECNDSSVRTEGNKALGNLKSGSDTAISITFINEVEWVEGRIKAQKTFSSPEKISIEKILEEVEKVYGGNYQFEFSLTIENRDENSIFKYKDTQYPNENNDKLEVTRTISITEFKDHFANTSDPFMVLFDEDTNGLLVKWPKYGKAPKYRVEEKNTGMFWTGTVNQSGDLIQDDTIIVQVDNNYSITKKWDLMTKLAGIVWKDEKVGNKQEIGNEDGRANGIYDDNEDLMSDVYVRVARILLKDGNEVDRKYNTQYQFIEDTENDFYYITNGEWHFDKVSVPAFTEEELNSGITYEAGYRVKYDVEFYYDGIKYQPTKFLVDAQGDTNNDKSQNYMVDSDNKVYFKNSHAIENGEDRQRWNKNYESVEGDTVIDENGNSIGKIGMAPVKYTGKLEENNGMITNTSIGTIQLDANSGDYYDKFMKATTGNGGLTYFFNGEMAQENNGQFEIIDNSGQFIELSPSDGGYYEERTVDKDGVHIRKHYKKIYDYALNINLGLIERPQVDLQLEKKIISATMIINENAQVYELSTDMGQDEIKIDDLNEDVRNALIQLPSKEVNTDFNIYTSDYNYRTSVYKGTQVADAYERFYKALYGYGTNEEVSNLINSKELQIYLTYGITVANRSGIYDVNIDTIDDYYDSTLEYVDVKTGYIADVNGGTYNNPNSGLHAYKGELNKDSNTPKLTDLFENHESWKTNTFNGDEFVEQGLAGIVNYNDRNYSLKKSKINVNDTISHNSVKQYFLTYRVNSYDRIKDGEFVLGNKVNIAEISKFTPYYTSEYLNYLNEGLDDSIKYSTENYTVPASVIDSDSAPGNYNIKLPSYFEDDTDYANVKLGLKQDTVRTISGTAWLDEEDGQIVDGQKLGDARLDGDNDLKIAGINTQLVEIIDLPEVTGNGITDNYTEYEFYWKDDSVVTDDDGSYILNSITSNSINNYGLIPGNYIVRFFYGDKDTTIKSDDKIVQINGEDYKTTAYATDSDRTKTDSYISNEWDDEIYKDDTSKVDNEARDSEARRLAIIKETQQLTNKNTSIFEISNYKDSEEYAEKKLVDYVKNIKKDMPKNPDNTDDIESMKEKYEEQYNLYKDRYDEYKSLLYGSAGNIKENIDNGIMQNGTPAYNNIILKNNSEELQDGYYMFADTAKMNLKVEKPDEKCEEIKGYNIGGINLGLEERSRTKMYLDKQAEEITLTTSSGKTFFHVVYDIDYLINTDIEKNDVKKGPSNIDKEHQDYNYNLIDYDEHDKIALWVGLKIKDEVIGANNLQALDDDMNAEKVIVQGFRYINIDSTVLQGLKLDIKYKISAINLSETDKYGQKLNNIITKETATEKSTSFNESISSLSSSVYKLEKANQTDGRLFFNDTNRYKKYGEFLGHTYYQGFNGDLAWTNDKTVTTTTHQVVDYIDNDIEFDALANTAWGTEENTKDQIGNRIDAFVFVDSKIQDPTEVNYKTIVTSIDSKDTNGDFVKELEPEHMVTTTISTSKLFASTDKGNTGMDNFAEILVIENTVGRRDMSTVYGNYDPRGGATLTTERDETSTEIVTLSPPTGNEENDRTMLIVISIICGVAVISGTAVGFKKKFSGKSKSKTE